MANRYSVSAVFKAVDKMSQPLSKMEKSTNKFSSKMQKNLGKANAAMGRISGGIK